MRPRRLRRLTVTLVLALPALGPAAAATGGACAAETSGAAHAALVIDTGERTTTYCVTLDRSSVTGVHLIQLAGAQYGLSYGLGFGGQAVCELDGTGPGGGDCFASYPDYWGYWHGDGNGGWTWASSGAASASVGDGDMDGWVWGPGDSGATHASPPALAFDAVCDTPTPGADPSPPPGGGSGSGSNGGAGAGGSGSGSSESGSGDSGSGTSGSGVPLPATVAAGIETPEPTPTAHATPAISAPTHAGEPEIVRASPINVRAASGDRGAAGPPLGALLALFAVVAFGVAGWVTLRRRGGADETR